MNQVYIYLDYKLYISIAIIILLLFNGERNTALGSYAIIQFEQN